MSKLLLLSILAMALFTAPAVCHNLFAASHPDHFVEKQTVFTWIGDQIKLVFWIISTIIVLPIGTVLALLGMPKVYSSMYDYVVATMFKLSSKKVVKDYI